MDAFLLICAAVLFGYSFWRAGAQHEEEWAEYTAQILERRASETKGGRDA